MQADKEHPHLAGPGRSEPDAQTSMELNPRPRQSQLSWGPQRCPWTWGRSGEQRTSWKPPPPEKWVLVKWGLQRSVTQCSRAQPLRCHRAISHWAGCARRGLQAHPLHAPAFNLSTNNTPMSTSEKPKALTSSRKPCVDVKT